MVRASVVVAVSLLAVASAQDTPASIAERAVVLILDAPAAANAVWPGFSLPDRDWLVYDSTGTYLVTKSAPPASFEPRGRWFFRAGAPAGLNGTLNTNYRLGDLTVTAIPAGPSPERTASVLYHEAFHAFQGERFRLLGPSMFAGSTVAHTLTAELAANIEVERRALRDAIRARGADGDRIREVLAVRARRSTAGGTALLDAERAAEQHEGLAQYVEERSIALARRQPPRAADDAIASRLEFPSRDIPGSPDERLIRARAYGTGAAIGILLDRLGVDWKLAAQTEALDPLLARHVVLQPERIPILAAETYRRYGYDSMLASRNPPWGDLRTFGETEFAALAPYRLVLEIEPSVTAGWSFSSEPGRPSGMHQPAPGVMLLPFADRFTASGTAISVTVTRRPVRLDLRTQPQMITILLPEAPRLNGERVVAGLDSTLSGLRVEAAGVNVTMTGSVRVTSELPQMRIARP